MERLLRRIIDPVVAPVRSAPRNDRDLLIAAVNSWVIAYDNLSGVPPWLSDALCRLATGGGLSTRELYTDSDEVIFDAMRPVILNGIDHLAERADLADRALILQLPRIENKINEQQLYLAFERDLPKLLGALYTAVSTALARIDQVSLPEKPRMADFALWATAGIPGFDLPPQVFLDAYCGNRAEAVQDTLEADAVAAAIFEFLERIAKDATDEWNGTCEVLLRELEQFANEEIRNHRLGPRRRAASQVGSGAFRRSSGTSMRLAFAQRVEGANDS